jgi:hypothetical protein
MADRIGFYPGGVVLNMTWQRTINGVNFTFRKSPMKKGFFLYNCSCRSEDERFVTASSTGFISDRDLSPEEVERLPQFDQFLGRGPGIRTTRG